MLREVIRAAEGGTNRAKVFHTLLQACSCTCTVFCFTLILTGRWLQQRIDFVERLHLVAAQRGADCPIVTNHPTYHAFKPAKVDSDVAARCLEILVLNIAWPVVNGACLISLDHVELGGGACPSTVGITSHVLCSYANNVVFANYQTADFVSFIIFFKRNWDRNGAFAVLGATAGFQNANVRQQRCRRGELDGFPFFCCHLAILRPFPVISGVNNLSDLVVVLFQSTGLITGVERKCKRRYVRP